MFFSLPNGQTPMFVCDVGLPSASRIESTTAEIAATSSINNAQAKFSLYLTWVFLHLFGLTMDAISS